MPLEYEYPNSQNNEEVGKKKKKKEEEIPALLTRITGTADWVNYMPSSGSIPTNSEKNRKLIDNYLYGSTKNESGQIIAPHFHPAVRSDAARLYTVNDKGEFVPAFPQASNPDWQGLTEDETADILSSDLKYVYFPAGSNVPQVFRNGELVQAHVIDPDNPEDAPDKVFRIKFGGEGNRRVKGKLSQDEITVMKNEDEVRRIEIGLFNIQRCSESYQSIYGSSFNDAGTDECRTYSQKFVYNMRNKVGEKNAASLVYPDPEGKLTEKDVAALTMLNMARPEINGTLLPSSADTITYGGYKKMTAGMFGQTNGIPESNYTEWGIKARQDLKPALEHYYKNGDPSALGKSIANGMHILAASGNNNPDLRSGTIASVTPQSFVVGLLNNHPDLLNAARREAIRMGTIEQFDDDLKKCKVSAVLRETGISGMQAQRRLLAYQNGEYKDKDGNVLKPTDEERKELEIKSAKHHFLHELGKHYSEQTKELLPHDLNEKIQQKVLDINSDSNADDKTKNIVSELAESESELRRQEMPLNPVHELIACHDDGMFALDEVMKSVDDPKDYDQVMNALKENKLIPEDGLPDPDFDYDKAIEPFAVKRLTRELGLKDSDIEKLAKASGFTVEEYGRRMLNENRYSEAGVTGDVKKYADEMGIDYAAMKTLADKNGVSVKEYSDRLYEDSLRAEKSAPQKNIQDILNDPDISSIEIPAEDSESHFLDDSAVDPIEDAPEDNVDQNSVEAIEEMLSDEKIKKLDGKQLCKTFKELNEISKNNMKDPVKLYLSGELLKKVFTYMVEYEKTHPDFIKDKVMNLKKNDFLEAQATILRSEKAAVKLKTGVTSLDSKILKELQEHNPEIEKHPQHDQPDPNQPNQPNQPSQPNPQNQPNPPIQAQTQPIIS